MTCGCGRKIGTQDETLAHGNKDNLRLPQRFNFEPLPIGNPLSFWATTRNTQRTTGVVGKVSLRGLRCQAKGLGLLGLRKKQFQEILQVRRILRC